MDGYFDEAHGSKLLAKRIFRILQFTKLPFSLMKSIIAYYGKKIIGRAGTGKERANNYYFLTLIHTGCKHIRLDSEIFLFKKERGPLFFSRQYPDSDLEVFNQVWGRREYQLATQRVKKDKRDNTPTHIIDAGANVGYSTLFFLQEFPNGQVISVEPEEKNFSMLEKNIAVNNLTGQVDLRKNGIWHRSNNLKVVNTFRDGCSWSAQVIETEEPSDLKGISLSDLVKEKGWQVIDLLKIDIEGAEKELFDNEESMKQILDITRVLALEIHDEIANREAIYAFLESCGFAHFDHNDLTIAYRE